MSRSDFNAYFDQGFNSTEVYRDIKRRFVDQQMQLYLDRISRSDS